LFADREEVFVQLVAVAGVTDHEPLLGVAGDDDVVHDAALFVADEGVLALADCAGGEVSRRDEIKKFGGVFSAEAQPAHVRHIKQAAAVSGVLVLIDERTQSAAERLALALEAATSVTFVGSSSAGAPSPATPLELPGSLTVGIPLVEVRRGDGSQIQRVGITPNVDARTTAKGVRNRQDEVLDRAQQWIVQQLDPPVRRKR